MGGLLHYFAAGPLQSVSNLGDVKNMRYHSFDPDELEESKLLEASTVFSLLEEAPDNSEMLRVLERQIGTLQVQLDNLEEDLSRLAEEPARQELLPRLTAQADRLAARIAELEAQADALENPTT